MELPEIYAMADAGDEDFLTESERAIAAIATRSEILVQ